MTKNLLLAALCLTTPFFASCANQSVATADAPAPFTPVPGPAQLHWHEAENLMFIHWGMKTFHPDGDHMGSGTDDAATFNPKKLDPAQWARVAKEAGFK